jgi:hypothetical protein
VGFEIQKLVVVFLPVGIENLQSVTDSTCIAFLETLAARYSLLSGRHGKLTIHDQ